MTTAIDKDSLHAEGFLPQDDALPDLTRLFDSEWAWRAFRSEAGSAEETPDRMRLGELLYWPGTRALATYVTERQWDHWLLEDQFSIELAPAQKTKFFRYPDDPHLSGLASVASAITAQELLPKHVPLHPQRLNVEVVRYRPTTRAVLRHTATWRRRETGQVTLVVRVVRPDRLPAFLAAAALAGHSGFVLPRLVGYCPEGGILWLSTVPGQTVRSLIREGRGPDPNSILDRLTTLWNARPDGDVRPPDLALYLRATEGLLLHVLQDEEARRMTRRVTEVLRPFVEGWKPTALAHNDFYDDQMLLTPEGRLALVDFEEIGPGDPLLDVGNQLAHLRWMARFGISPELCGAYRRDFREASLDRFGWDDRALGLREAFALFRLASNPVRKLRPHWQRDVKTSLSLVADALDGAA